MHSLYSLRVTKWPSYDVPSLWASESCIVEPKNRDLQNCLLHDSCSNMCLSTRT